MGYEQDPEEHDERGNAWHPRRRDGGSVGPEEDVEADEEDPRRGGSLERRRASDDAERASDEEAIQGDIFEEHPEVERRVRRQIKREVRRYSGPIPDPATLARFGEIDPDLVNRIVSMAEAEVYTKTNVMKTLSRAEGYAVAVGATSSAVVATGGLGAAVWLIANGHPAESLLLAIPAVLGGTAGLAKALKKDRDEDSENNSDNSGEATN